MRRKKNAIKSDHDRNHARMDALRRPAHRHHRHARSSRIHQEHDERRGRRRRRILVIDALRASPIRPTATRICCGCWDVPEIIVGRQQDRFRARTRSSASRDQPRYSLRARKQPVSRCARSCRSPRAMATTSSIARTHRLVRRPTLIDVLVAAAPAAPLADRALRFDIADVYRQRRPSASRSAPSLRARLRRRPRAHCTERCDDARARHQTVSRRRLSRACG